MGYEIRAVIGRQEQIATLRAYEGVRAVVLADPAFALVPMTDALFDAVNAGAAVTRDLSDEFEFLSTAVTRWVKDGSRTGRLIYVEAEYFGGTGAQSAIGFARGEVSLAAAKAEGGPINAALRFLGVVQALGRDEFDTVGLGRHRHLEKLDVGSRGGGRPGRPRRDATVVQGNVDLNRARAALGMAAEGREATRARSRQGGHDRPTERDWKVLRQRTHRRRSGG